MKQVAVIHFSPVELYPPVLNFLNFASQKQMRVAVYTTKPESRFRMFSHSGIRLRRFGDFSSQSRLSRFVNYCWFYVRAFISLLFIRPQQIIYYETNSFFPVWLLMKVYKMAGKRLIVHCHYHEYTSPEEYGSGMAITRIQHKLEKASYSLFSGISHTNRFRVGLFRKDVANLNVPVFVFPNYPPKRWSDNKSVKVIERLPIKLVYVGALNLNTMYVAEFAKWVKEMNGKIEWDIYTQQRADEVSIFLQGLNCNYIKLKGKTEYSDIPERLNGYDAGVILYKGHTLNYIFNETNKLFEYLCCGLSVWYPKGMHGIKRYENIRSFPKVLSIDFTSLSEKNIKDLITPAEIKPCIKNSEEACERFLSKIL